MISYYQCRKTRPAANFNTETLKKPPRESAVTYMLETLDSTIALVLWVAFPIAAIVLFALIIVVMGENNFLMTSIKRGCGRIVKDPGGNFVKFLGNIHGHVVNKDTGFITEVSDTTSSKNRAARIPFFGYHWMGFNPLLKIHDPNIEYSTSKSSGENGSELKTVVVRINKDLPFQENLTIDLKDMETRNEPNGSGPDIPIILINMSLVVSVRMVSFGAYGTFQDDTSAWTNVVTEMANAAAQTVLGMATYNNIVLRKKVVVMGKDKDGKDAEIDTFEIGPKIADLLNERLKELYKSSSGGASPLLVLSVQITNPALSENNPPEVKKLFSDLNTTRQILGLKLLEAENALKVEQLRAKGNAASIQAAVDAFKGNRAAALELLKSGQMAEAIKVAKPGVISITENKGGQGSNNPPIIVDGTGKRPEPPDGPKPSNN